MYKWFIQVDPVWGALIQHSGVNGGFDVIGKIEQVVQVRNWVTSTPLPSGMAATTPVQPARASS